MLVVTICGLTNCARVCVVLCRAAGDFAQDGGVTCEGKECVLSGRPHKHCILLVCCQATQTCVQRTSASPVLHCRHFWC